MFKPTTILHPTDFHPTSMEAFGVAEELAGVYGAKLLVMHVPEYPPIAYAEFVPPIEPDFEKIRSEAMLQLAMLKRKDGGSIEYIISSKGTPDTEIVREADDRSVDLIVMGTTGRRGISRMLLGSVAEYVLRKAHCPVLLVKPGVPASNMLADRMEAANAKT